jgi:parvulin-like peptidyl-prolyl isomerase
MAVQEKDPRGAAPGGPKGGNGTPRSARERARYDEEPGPLSMSGIRTGLMHSIFMKVVLGLLILIFAAGFAFQSLLGPGDAGTNGAPRVLGSGPDPVASVGDEGIARNKFQTALQRTIAMNEQFGQPTGPDQLLATRQQTLGQLTDEAARYAEAKRRGITATDAEIDAKITEEIGKVKNPPGQSAATVRRQLESEHGSVEAWEQKTREGITSEAREEIARGIVLEKLEKQIKDENKVTEEDYKRSVTRLKLRQIKISPQAPSPTAKDAKAEQEKNEAAAKAEAEKLAATLKNANVAQFAAAAKQHSDDVTTKAKGGDLGAKMPIELPIAPAMRDAIVNADGKIVGPVQDEYSKDWNIFFIENRKLELPKDYNAKKKEYLKTFEEQKDNEFWAKFQEDLKKKTTPEIQDPALQAYKIQSEQIFTAQGDEQNRLRQEALDKYNEALGYASDSERAAIQYQMAQLYRDLRQPDKQMEALKAAAEQKNFKQARIEYARALRDAKKNNEALKELQDLSKQLDENPSQPSMFGGGNPDDSIRFQIASEFEALGKKDLAQKERGKIKPPQAQPGMNFGGGQPPITINPSQ